MTAEKATEITTIQRALDGMMRRVRTLIPAQVVTYQEAGEFGPCATCQILRMGVDLAGIPYAIPPIANCPVMWPRGGGMAIWGMLMPGDEVMLGIADRSLDEFILRAPGGPPMPPGDARSFNLADAVVILGLSSAGNALPPAAGSFRVGREDGTATVRISIVGPGEVEIEAASIKLGVAAALAAARATDPLTGSASAAAWATLVEGACNVAAPGTFIGANTWLATVAPPGSLGAITSGSTKVKAE